MHEVSMILIIYDVQLGIIGLKQFFFRSIRRYIHEVFENLPRFLRSVATSCKRLKQTSYIQPISHTTRHISHLFISTDLQWEIMCQIAFCCYLFHFLTLALRPWYFCLVTGVGHINPKRFTEYFLICSRSDQYRTPIFSGCFDLQLMLSCSVVAILSSLLGLVGFAGLGHHYYHHSPHGIFGEEVKDWSHDHHRHGHSMEAMKQILWWGFFLLQKIVGLKFLKLINCFCFFSPSLWFEYWRSPTKIHISRYFLCTFASNGPLRWNKKNNTNCFSTKKHVVRSLRGNPIGFWIRESTPELPKPVWRPNSPWVSTRRICYVYKHHVCCLLAFFVVFFYCTTQYVYLYDMFCCKQGMCACFYANHSNIRWQVSKGWQRDQRNRTIHPEPIHGWGWRCTFLDLSPSNHLVILVIPIGW